MPVLLGLAAPATAPAIITTAELSNRASMARDSVLTQAAAIRADTEVRLTSFKAAFRGLSGIRQRVNSYGVTAFDTGGAIFNAKARLKKHVVKHKTNGAKVEKIDYFTADGKLLLTERYVQSKLVRLELFEYTPVTVSKGLPPMYESGSWLLVSGNYLRRIRRVYKPARKAYYFQRLLMPAE